MEKLDLTTPNFTNENIAKLAELFPNCVTERENDKGKIEYAIDFDALRQEFSDTIVEGLQERYQLNWPGKREALVTANTPISKTLRPCRDESVDFDTTKNIFIEGDNLDALKLLQETYLSKVKMIYIDPPYNTGNDFIYNDSFTADKGEYDEASGQRDEDGGRLVANPDSNGRYHSDWLSMMYPRLKLARNIMREDGVIFISIDDGEVGNLRKVCDEVFGAGNFVANIIWEKADSPRMDSEFFSSRHDHILVFAKSIDKFKIQRKKYSNKNLPAHYNKVDQDGRKYYLKPLRAMGGQGETRAARPNLYYGIISPNGNEVFPKLQDGSDGAWRWSKSKLEKEHDRIIWTGNAEEQVPNYKIYADKSSGLPPETIFYNKNVGSNRTSTAQLKNLFSGSKLFDSPKPVSLLKSLIELQLFSEEDLVLDFFAGSSTTAHAVLQLNADDGGNRKFIMAQLPENTDKNSDAYKSGFINIADVSKERIRRAGKKIKEENADKEGIENLDTGFRVFKIDSSNMVDVTLSPDEAHPDMFDAQIGNIKKDRSSEDLLFQVLLDWGVDLSLPINCEDINGKEVFFVDGNALAACFDNDINEDFVKKIAEKQPLRVVFRDDGFVSDSVKINVEQIFKLKSPATDIKVV